jgi:hypothetical protein
MTIPHIPTAVWEAYTDMDRASADVLRALVDGKDDKLLEALHRVQGFRNMLVKELMAWRPEMWAEAEEVLKT